MLGVVGMGREEAAKAASENSTSETPTLAARLSDFNGLGERKIAATSSVGSGVMTIVATAITTSSARKSENSRGATRDTLLACFTLDFHLELKNPQL